MQEPKFPQIWLSPYFWFVVLGTAVFKASAVPDVPPKKRAFTLISGLFFAAIGAEPAIEYLKLADSSVKYVLIGLITLTGEHIARLAMAIAENPKVGFDLWQKFRGGGGNAP